MTKYNKILGIDHGNGFFKVVTANGRGIRKFKFPSMIAPIDEFREVDAAIGKKEKYDEYELLEYPGEVYTFGDHVTIGTSGLSTNGLGKARYKNKAYKLLTKAVLAHLVEDDDKVLVVTGSPASERLSEEIEELIKDVYDGTHTVKHNGTSKTFKVKCLIKGQPMGTYFEELLDNAGDMSNKIDTKEDYVGILDIGTFTSDTAGIQKMRPVAGDITTSSIGMHDIYKEVANYIDEKLSGQKVNTYRVEQAVRNKSKVFKRGMDEVEIAEVTNKAIKKVGDKIISDIHTYWKNKDEFTKIYVTGGGASILGDYLKENWESRITVIEEPLYANALGFYRFGAMAAKHNRV